MLRILLKNPIGFVKQEEMAAFYCASGIWASCLGEIKGEMADIARAIQKSVV